MAHKIHVYIKDPGEPPRSVSLEDLQKTVGGKYRVDTVIFAGVDGEELADVPCDFKTFKRLFPGLWEVAL